MKIRPVGTELFHTDRRIDGCTDITKLEVAFRNFANAPKKIGHSGSEVTDVVLCCVVLCCVVLCCVVLCCVVLCL